MPSGNFEDLLSLPFDELHTKPPLQYILSEKNSDSHLFLSDLSQEIGGCHYLLSIKQCLNLSVTQSESHWEFPSRCDCLSHQMGGGELLYQISSTENRDGQPFRLLFLDLVLAQIGESPDLFLSLLSYIHLSEKRIMGFLLPLR